MTTDDIADAGTDFYGNPTDATASTADATAEPSAAPADPDPVFEVTVNGQPKQVSLTELQNGYMMQSDYTRKTQELANLRQEAEQGMLIMDALSSNPHEALSAMAEHYGISLGQPQPQAQRQDALDYGDPFDDSPAPTPDPRIAQLEAEINALKTQNAQTNLQNEAAELMSKYGVSEEDVQAAKRHAVLHNFPTVEDAFKSLHFGSAWEAKQVADARAAEDARILAEKRDAQGVVGTQASPARGSLTDSRASSEKLSIREAMMEALRENNMEVRDLTQIL